MLEPQLIAVLLIVAVAVAYIVRRTIRTWGSGKKGGCGGGCGCARVVERVEPAKDSLIPSEQVQVRKR